jgi:chemotaxis regulatin CheY-phosphate phosphatase CheZ
MRQVPTLDDAAYHEIEEAISSTPRGRAFLRLRDHRASLIARDAIGRLSGDINEILDRRLAGQQAQGNLGVMHRELQDLRAHIERSRAEIARIATKDGEAGSGARISKATEELYEIVASTERATSDILGAAEAIQERIAPLGLKPEDRQAVEDRCMEIFTACSFQDITGQRIAKVVSTMSYVEQRVGAMIAMWDGNGEAVGSVRTSQGGGQSGGAGAAAEDPDAHLLNGPQMPGDGLGQDAVDALFGPARPDPTAAAPAPAVPARTPSMPPKPVTKAAAREIRLSPVPKATPAPKSPAAASAPAATKLNQSAVDALFD